jgi:hypothetical protein
VASVDTNVCSHPADGGGNGWENRCVAGTAAYDPTRWSDLFVATAGASAALAGLVFVAVSINIEPILRGPGLAERALETVLLLLGVVVVSVLALVPEQGPTALGLEVLGAGLAWTAVLAALLRRSVPHYHGRRPWLVLRLVLTAAGVLPFVACGVSLLAGAGGGLFWALGGIVAALVGAVLNAWVLLVEIRR